MLTVTIRLAPYLALLIVSACSPSNAPDAQLDVELVKAARQVADPLGAVAPFVVWPSGGEVSKPNAVQPETKPVEVGAQEAKAPMVVKAPLDRFKPLKKRSRRRGFCAQIRAFEARQEAESLAGKILEEHLLPVAILKKDLGQRGVWYRVCVLDEATSRSAKRKAARLTKKTLLPYLEEGQSALFFVKSRTRKDGFWLPEPEPVKQEAFVEPPPKPTAPKPATQKPREPTPTKRMLSEAQANALLGHSPSEERSIYAWPLSPNPMAAIVDDGLHVFDENAKALEVVPAAPGACALCDSAMKAGIAKREILGVEARGEQYDLLALETSSEGDVLLTVYRLVETAKSKIIRASHQIYLGRERASLRLLVKARYLDADRQDALDVGVIERSMEIAEDRLCALRSSGRVFRFEGDTSEALTPGYAETMSFSETTASAASASALVDAFDELDDHAKASSACSRFFIRGKNPELARKCIERITSLKSESLLLAVNAAGALAFRAKAYRAVIAKPFYDVMLALDKDPRLSAGAFDCAMMPLATKVSEKSDDELLKIAKVRLAERLSLASIEKEVFLTAARDFGPNTPVGKIAKQWLERIKIALPARHAAIQAALAEGEP